ncbi:hypothetical protein D3C86_1285290 [compost metagenome]
MRVRHLLLPKWMSLSTRSSRRIAAVDSCIMRSVPACAKGLRQRELSRIKSLRGQGLRTTHRASRWRNGLLTSGDFRWRCAASI